MALQSSLLYPVVTSAASRPEDSSGIARSNSHPFAGSESLFEKREIQ